MHIPIGGGGSRSKRKAAYENTPHHLLDCFFATLVDDRSHRRIELRVLVVLTRIHRSRWQTGTHVH